MDVIFAVVSLIKKYPYIYDKSHVHHNPGAVKLAWTYIAYECKFQVTINYCKNMFKHLLSIYVKARRIALRQGFCRWPCYDLMLFFDPYIEYLCETYVKTPRNVDELMKMQSSGSTTSHAEDSVILVYDDNDNPYVPYYTDQDVMCEKDYYGMDVPENVVAHFPDENEDELSYLCYINTQLNEDEELALQTQTEVEIDLDNTRTRTVFNMASHTGTARHPIVGPPPGISEKYSMYLDIETGEYQHIMPVSEPTKSRRRTLKGHQQQPARGGRKRPRLGCSQIELIDGNLVAVYITKYKNEVLMYDSIKDIYFQKVYFINEKTDLIELDDVKLEVAQPKISKARRSKTQKTCKLKHKSTSKTNGKGNLISTQH